MRKSMWVGIVLLVGMFGVLQSAWGQEVTASIVGTVTDSSGAPIKGAEVRATDADRGTVWNATTNDTGDYHLLRLPVGSYGVRVTAAGFDTTAYPPFTLVLNQTARLDVQLKVGKVSETVEVAGVAPILQTQTTEVSTVIDSNTLSSMALVSRNYLQLTLLAPGATTPSIGEFTNPGLITASGRPYINGNREQANALLLDGIDASENSNNEVGYTPSPDAIQEFNLITQNASAEFGSYEGGVISTTIKSGTNQLHGSAFEFYRDGNLNANNWANGLVSPVIPSPGLVYNQFGVAVGGPIIKNKLFFFADYEGQHFDTPPSPGTVFVLTSAERSGDFGTLCTSAGGSFSGAGICTGGTQLTDPNNGNAPIPFNNFANASLASRTENPVTAALFNGIASGNAEGNITALNGQQINNDQGDLKIDYNLSEKDHVNGRWSQGHIRNPFSSTFALSAVTPATEPVRNFSAQWLHTLHSNLLNELRLGFNVVDYNQTGGVAGSVGNLAQTIGIVGGNTYASGLPNLLAGPLNIGSDDLVQGFHTSTPQVADSFSIIHGRHQFKFGFQYERLRLDNVYTGNSGELGSVTFNSLTGNPLGDLWMGNVASVGRGDIPPNFGRRGTVFGIFGQDDWRITDTITLNLGLRFEDHTPFYEIHNKEVNFAGGGLVAGGLQVEQGNNTLYNNYTGIGDLLPRIGIAWSPAALHNKTVVRLGYGISEYTEGGGVGEQLTANYPFTAASYNASTPTAIGNLGNVFANAAVTQPCPTITLSCYAGVESIYMFDPNFRPALAQQWNLTFQQQLSDSTTAQIGYVGQHGTHLYNFMEYNQTPLLNASGNVITQPGVLGTPGTPYYLSGDPTLLSEITFARGNASNADQKYDALQAVLQHRMAKGLDAQVAYTYSKCMSNSGGFYGTWASGTQTSHGQVGWTSIFAPHMDWGPCFFDETHILTSYVTYQLPFGRGKTFGSGVSPIVNAVLGNWEVGGIMTAHSGNAMSDFTGWGADYPGDATGGASELFGGDRTNCNGSVNYTKNFVPAVGATPAYIQWFNPSSFSLPTRTTDSAGNTVESSYGTCPQGGIRGPRYFDLDLSLHKAFAITERMGLELRGEAFNAFNHPSLGAPDLTYTDGDVRGFGAITSAGPSRQFQMGLKFTF
ncbi:MAG: TonB-dependent receptor [Candidatus Sulfotelmatobacter sp.]